MSSTGRLLPKSRSLISLRVSVSTRFLRSSSGRQGIETLASRLVACPGDDKARASSQRDLLIVEGLLQRLDERDAFHSLLSSSCSSTSMAVDGSRLPAASAANRRLP
jgi:hypothetical protein